MSEKKTSYEAEDIKALSDRDHVRLRPSMYLGSADSDGVYHGLKEVIDNSLDEYLGKHATKILIEIQDEGPDPFIRVMDNGRGIPVEKNNQTGESTLITVLTVGRAGGKFGKGAYATSAGLHGIGIKATNFTSVWLKATSWREGKCFTVDFHDGGLYDKAKGVTHNKARDNEIAHGTELRYWYDNKILRGTLDVARLKEHLQKVVYLCPGISITLKHNGEKTKFKSDENTGLGHFLIDRVQKNGDTLLHDPVTFTNPEGTIQAAFVWSDSTEDEESAWSWVNLSPTPEHGTHLAGLSRAIGKATSDLAPEKLKLTPKDLRVGLYMAIHCKVGSPQFKGQTKTKLGNEEIETQVNDFVLPLLVKYFSGQKSLVKVLLERAANFRKAREEYKKIKGTLKNLTAGKSTRSNLPIKLVSSPDCTNEERALFLVEGDCLAEGTLVYTEDGLMPIETNLEGVPIRSVGSFIEATKWHHYKTRKVYTVKTKLGYTLTMSPKHPLARFNEDMTSEWVTPKNIAVGNRVLLKRGGAKFAKEALPLKFDFNPAFNRSCGSCTFLNKGACDATQEERKPEDAACHLYAFSKRICPVCGEKYARLDLHLTRTHGRSIKEFNINQDVGDLPSNLTDLGNRKMPTHMSNELALILGYLVAEGTMVTMDQGIIRFANTDPNVIEEFRSCWSKVFGRDLTVEPTEVRTVDRVAAQFLQKIGLVSKESQNQEIPWSILRSTKEHVKLFLSALFEGDAWSGKGQNTTRDYKMLEYYSSSPKMLDQLHVLLLGLGMITSRTGELITEWRDPRTHTVKQLPVPYVMGQIRFHGENFRRFHKNIGFRTDKKRLDLNSEKPRQKASFCKTINLPYVKKYLKTLKEEYFDVTNPSQRKWNTPEGTSQQMHFGAYITGSSTLNYRRMPAQFLEEIEIYNPDARQTLEFIRDEKLFADEVVSVEAKDIIADVYDVTVEDTHCFYSNGFLSHNSAGGNTIEARNPYYQEVLPLRGKIINTERCSAAQALQNTEVQSLIQAIGITLDAEGGKKHSTANARAGKIFLLCDGDQDGCGQASTLVRMFDGPPTTLKELAQRTRDTNETFLVHSINAAGEIVPGVAHSARVTKTVSSMYHITLSDGSVLRFTGNHPFAVCPDNNDDRVWVDKGVYYINAENLRTSDILRACKHSIVHVEEVPCHEEEVYDLTVEQYGNFMLENGVFVHNSHISTLILAFLMNYARDMVAEGKVYVVESPLFKATDNAGKHRWFGDSVEEIEKKSGLKADSGKLQVSRLKGHGEASADDIHHYAMNPSTRKVIQLKLDAEGSIQRFSEYMGSESDARKIILGIVLWRHVKLSTKIPPFPQTQMCVCLMGMSSPKKLCCALVPMPSWTGLCLMFVTG
jgi:DNA gyrase/topoisomerase IV subunit B